MPDYRLSAETILLALPQVLREDSNMLALARAVAEALSAQANELDVIRIYPAVDILPESLLDLLAYDFKVDWWVSSYSLEEKRDILAKSWNVHRALGTKYAMETSISSVYEDSRVQEWFEYGGEPYHFKIQINARYEDTDPAKHARVLERVSVYKSLRSVLDEVEYYDGGGTATGYMTAAIIAEELTDSAAAVRY